MSLCCCSVNLLGRQKSSISIVSNMSGQKLKLTESQKALLVATWHSIPDKDQLGMEILLEIFELRPQLKKLFSFKDTEDLLDSKQFQRHASAFMQFLEIAIKSLDVDPHYMVSLCRNLGIRHVAFKGVSFAAENWLTFKTAMVTKMSKYSSGKRAYKVLNVFISFIIREMKDAFFKETHKRHSIVDLLMDNGTGGRPMSESESDQSKLSLSVISEHADDDVGDDAVARDRKSENQSRVQSCDQLVVDINRTGGDDDDIDDCSNVLTVSSEHQPLLAGNNNEGCCPEDCFDENVDFSCNKGMDTNLDFQKDNKTDSTLEPNKEEMVSRKNVSDNRYVKADSEIEEPKDFCIINQSNCQGNLDLDHSKSDLDQSSASSLAVDQNGSFPCSVCDFEYSNPHCHPVASAKSSTKSNHPDCFVDG